MIIYKITNLVNQKIYIGQTTQTIKIRWRAHCSKTSNCIALRNSIQKHGKHNFKIEQIDSALELEELNKKEEYWILFYNSTNPKNGYNLTTGGDSRLHSEASKLKMSKTRKGRKMSDAGKLALSIANKGRKMPQHVKDLLLSKNKGRPLSDSHKAKLSIASSKKKLSESHKKALLDAAQEALKDPEKNKARIEKMANSLRGKKRSPESIKKQLDTYYRNKLNKDSEDRA